MCVFLSYPLRRFLLQLTTSELTWLNLYIPPLYHHPQPHTYWHTDVCVCGCMCDNPELQRRDVPQWSQLTKVTHKPVSTHTDGSLYLIFLSINSLLFNSLRFLHCSVSLHFVFDDSHMMSVEILSRRGDRRASCLFSTQPWVTYYLPITVRVHVCRIS